MLNGLFEPLQSAYRQGHSTETALLKVQNDMLVAMDSQQVSILILLDLSAAFDTFNHDVLLKRLKERCGVQGKALKWFESYLTDRFQMVTLKEITSKRVALHCGLPQGSVLGPLLFLVYTLPLRDFIKRKGLQFHLYADDTQIYMSFTPNSSGVANSLERIEQCIQEVSSWMSANRLKLNGNKMKILVVGTPQQCLKVSNLTLNVADSIIESNETVKNLGAIFDKHMNHKALVNAICKAARYHLYNISLARRYLTREAAEKAIHAFVISRLDSNNALIQGLPCCELKKLQKVQNAAARLLVGVSRKCHITPILRELHWLPVVCRIQYKILLLTFKCIKNIAPKYLIVLLKKRTAPRATRSAKDDLLLEIKRTNLVTAGDRSFAHVAPCLWNELPYSLRAANSVETFKTLLKTFLFRRHFSIKNV